VTHRFKTSASETKKADDDEDEIQAKIGAQERRALDEQGRVVGGRRVI
jgi:hypothetical protein